MRCLSAAIAVALVLGSLGSSFGSVQSFSDRATFNTQGAIHYNDGFEDTTFLFHDGYAAPGNPWETHGVVYSGQGNQLIGTSRPYAPPVSTVFNDAGNGTIVATMSPSTVPYNMLGMDVAIFAKAGDLSISLQTNVNSYSFALANLPDVSQSQKFFGFVTSTPNEYFTGFTIPFALPNTSFVHAAIDNVTLGTTVPEPAGLTLLSTALAAVAGAVYLRRTNRV